MAEGEVIILIVSLMIAVISAPFAGGWWLHRFYIRRNAAAAVPLLAVLAAMVWIVYVLWNHADPSVTGVYQFFYLMMGLALVVGPGFWTPYCYGLRTSVDVFQRRNMAVAVVVGAFVLSTGLIFGGCNWGEADPNSDSEGGWWIPLGFFLAGWAALLMVSAIYVRGERHSLRQRLVQDRSLSEARSAASFLIGAALVLTHAVAGDFWGWTEGLLGVGAVALMIATHEGCRRMVPKVLTTTESQAAVVPPGRYLESVAYLVISLGFGLLSYWLTG